MSWVKLDDGFFRHPKVLNAGRDARDIYVAGLCYCAQGLTDGHIPATAVRVLAAEAEVDDWKTAADRLIEVGLWEIGPAGYLVHDYLEYNPTREKALETREARAEAGRRGGKQKASNLLDKSLANAVAKPKQNSDKSLPRTRTRTPSPDVSPDGDTPRNPPETKPDKAFDLFMAMCQELNVEPSEITGQQRNKQLAAGKRLASSGATADDVRHEIRWLSSLNWVNGIDLVLVDGQRTKWLTAGKPIGATARAPTPMPQRPGTYNASQLADMARNGGTNGPSRDDETFVDSQFRLVQ